MPAQDLSQTTRRAVVAGGVDPGDVRLSTIYKRSLNALPRRGSTATLRADGAAPPARFPFNPATLARSIFRFRGAPGRLRWVGLGQLPLSLLRAVVATDFHQHEARKSDSE